MMVECFVAVYLGTWAGYQIPACCSLLSLLVVRTEVISGEEASIDLAFQEPDDNNKVIFKNLNI